MYIHLRKFNRFEHDSELLKNKKNKLENNSLRLITNTFSYMGWCLRYGETITVISDYDEFCTVLFQDKFTTLNLPKKLLEENTLEIIQD